MERIAKHQGLAALALLVCALAVAGCSARHYRKSADQETYRVIAEKTPLVPNMDPDFTIEQTTALSLEGLLISTNVDEFFGPYGETERGAFVLPLEKALELAVHHSRIYQSSKENLYLQALQLTLTRHQLTPLFSGRASPGYQVNTEAIRVGIDEITGQPKALLGADAQIVEQHRVTGQGNAGVSWLLRAGTRLSTAFTTDFLRYLTGDPRTFTQSQLSAQLVQPLLQGAGKNSPTWENLTQAERIMLYSLRNFTQFRKRFSVDIASAYYGVLGSRDAVRNSWLGLQNFKRSAERERALADEGQRAQASLGRLRQAQLNTETTWINSIRAYRQSLDNFKIQLGLSTDAHVALDDRELARLKVDHPDLSAEDAIKVALVTRLDLYNERDQHEDAHRRVRLAANGLKPRIDLAASMGMSSQAESGTGIPLPDPSRYRWNAGLDVDLPLDRKAQRNTYRQVLIGYKQSARDLEQREDEIKLQIRNDWRNLDQAKRNYESAEIGVELNQRRVEEQELRADVGRGSAQDLVDAQNDLITSKNQLTQALVTHTISRLQFWNDMGILNIQERGQWEEVSDAKQLKNN